MDFKAIYNSLPWYRAFIRKQMKTNTNELRSISRPNPETNESQHQRVAQHIGSPRRGAPGRRRHECK
jgi:hypothetical protein